MLGAGERKIAASLGCSGQALTFSSYPARSDAGSGGV